jgi:threonine aldolase
MRSFGSDNHSGTHPLILNAMMEANQDHTPSYGTDPWTEKTSDCMSELFGKNVKTFFVYNGTAANVAALRACTRPWNSVLCSDVAHLAMDECGAPEYLAGIKLTPVPSHHGKVSLEDLKKKLIRRGDQHFSQAKVISITQPTEYGTCYSLQEIRAIVNWAHQEGLFVHVDGARLANAVAFLKTSLNEMLTRTGVDVVSFGGTKNGLAFGEAVVFLNESLAADFVFLRKQMGQLPSKTRFISAAFMRYLQDDLYLEIANSVHSKALHLRQLVSGIPGVEVTTPVESNAVFAKIPQAWVKTLRKDYFFYVWDEQTFECRWMISFDTTEEDLLGFAKKLRELSTTGF